MRFVNSIPLWAMLALASCGLEMGSSFRGETSRGEASRGEASRGEASRGEASEGGGNLDVNVGKAQSAIEVCSTGPTTFGIDVSRYQGDIDWNLVAGADVKFAYIQISRAIDDIDPNFEVNWAGASSAGILRGAYQRFQPDQDVQAQANIFLDKLGPFEAGDLPPMLDVEDSGGLPGATIAQRTREWLEIVEAATGVRPIIYTGFYFWRDTVNSADFTDYPLWIAHYTKDCPNIPEPWTDWAIHQYSASAVLPGITVNTVDVNHFNGTARDLLALAGAPECGDGVCTGTETSDRCLEDCPPCQRIGSLGDTLDDKGACFDVGGDPQYMRTEDVGHEGQLTWTHTTDAEQASNFGQWNLFFDQAGIYFVEAFTAAPHAMSKQAAYQVLHGGEDTASVVNQSAIDGWSPVGEFSFAAGGGQAIRLDDNTGESNEQDTKLVFDAIRLTRLDPPMDADAGVEPGDDGDNDGCQAGGTGSSGAGALLVFALLLATRRRREFR